MHTIDHETIDAAMAYAYEPSTQAALARKQSKVWTGDKPTADETALAFSDAVHALMRKEDADAFLGTVSHMLTALVLARTENEGSDIGQRSTLTA